MSISEHDRRELLALARSAVEAEVAGRPLPRRAPQDGILGELRGCFVTLTNKGSLRGCIGTFQPNQPLGPTIVEMGRAAARDPRFLYYRPIKPEELPEITVQVSVLSPLQETKNPLSLEVGTHGIYVICGRQAGCFLPEVATDQGWDAETFLTECCRGKAGLPADAWRLPTAKVFLFTSEKFSE
jgi:AmmeMemoRadiSam system protein A